MDQVVGINCFMMIVNLMKMVNKTKNQSLCRSLIQFQQRKEVTKILTLFFHTRSRSMFESSCLLVSDF